MWQIAQKTDRANEKEEKENPPGLASDRASGECGTMISPSKTDETQDDSCELEYMLDDFPTKTPYVSTNAVETQDKAAKLEYIKDEKDVVRLNEDEEEAVTFRHERGMDRKIRAETRHRSGMDRKVKDGKRQRAPEQTEVESSIESSENKVVPGAVPVEGPSVQRSDTPTNRNEGPDAQRSDIPTDRISQNELVMSAELVEADMICDVEDAVSRLLQKDREKHEIVTATPITICGLPRKAFAVAAVLVIALVASLSAVLTKKSTEMDQNTITGIDKPGTSPPATSPPTTSRFDAMLNQIAQLSPNVMTPSSSQEDTVRWLADDDPAELALNTVPSILIQRYVMALLYFALEGAKWTKSDQWLTASSECTWHGTVCNSEGFVTEINHDPNNLSGSLPTEILLLTDLGFLRLKHNQLTGNIPSGIANLSNLKIYWMEGNPITGTIPTELGLMTNMLRFWLHNMTLTGTIPTQFGLLTTLIRLNLNSNQLTGTIPTEHGLLTRITDLFLGSNDLNGTIPTELGWLSRRLEYLQLESNRLSGPIPTELGLLTALTSLNLADNELSGTVPTELAALSNSTDISYSGNNVTR